jgi:uncharacterized repeat protein (TIGR03843 family)
MGISSEEDFAALILAGELRVTGRLVDASNATLFGTLDTSDGEMAVVYKPVAGERPLWDFETGTLAARERAAFLLSEFLGLHLVPATVLRDGPFGFGAVQRWIDVNEEIDLIDFGQSDSGRLRQMALFDAIINNTDRKFGHILVASDGAVFGCDHGVTFHSEDKLRTVLWQFAGDLLDNDERAALDRISDEREQVAALLSSLLSESEIGALFERVERLHSQSAYPLPNPEWPAVPWPPV